jgi:hypothetical protein
MFKVSLLIVSQNFSKQSFTFGWNCNHGFIIEPFFSSWNGTFGAVVVGGKEEK